MRQFIQYALKFLSTAILKKYNPKIVAITGSAGKSSAKEAIFLVLKSAYEDKVRCNFENLNTEIGAPLVIIGGVDAKRNTFLWLRNFFKGIKLILIKDFNYPKILILEMAADRPGDIKYLTSFAHPDIAVVTAIGEMPVHLEFFPERDRYISEKANILKNLKPKGLAVLNYDDLSVRNLRDMVPTGRDRVYYGFQAGADVRIANFSYKLPQVAADIKNTSTSFKIEFQGDDVDSEIHKTLGVPPLYAVLAAVAVGLRFGLTLKRISIALENYRPPKNRLEIIAGVKETIIIDDSYNASPLAVEAALDLLAKFKKHRRLAVLGSMKELGINTEGAHRLIGRKVAKVADIVFLVGDEMVFAKEEAIKFGLKLGENLFWFDSSEEAKLKIQEILESQDVVLIKGSRAVKMETIVKEIAVIV